MERRWFSRGGELIRHSRTEKRTRNESTGNYTGDVVATDGGQKSEFLKMQKTTLGFNRDFFQAH